jgi:hypothetical protein
MIMNQWSVLWNFIFFQRIHPLEELEPRRREFQMLEMRRERTSKTRYFTIVGIAIILTVGPAFMNKSP